MTDLEYEQLRERLKLAKALKDKIIFCKGKVVEYTRYSDEETKNSFKAKEGAKDKLAYWIKQLSDAKQNFKNL